MMHFVQLIRTEIKWMFVFNNKKDLVRGNEGVFANLYPNASNSDYIHDLKFLIFNGHEIFLVKNFKVILPISSAHHKTSSTRREKSKKK